MGRGESRHETYLRLLLQNETKFGLNEELSGWNMIDPYEFIFEQWKFGFEVGVQKPSDYLLVFSDDCNTCNEMPTGQL